MRPVNCDRQLDLIDTMVSSADESISDEEVEAIERAACPAGCCSECSPPDELPDRSPGTCTPGHGTILATHKNRIRLMKDAAAHSPQCP